MLAGIQSRYNELRKALLDGEAALREVEKEQERFHCMADRSAPVSVRCLPKRLQSVSQSWQVNILLFANPHDLIALRALAVCQ